MGLLTAVALAFGATQVIGGMMQKKEGDYNASVLHQQAGMIDEQKKLQFYQDDRAIRKIMGQTVATTAGKGIKMSGSPIAIMIDTRTQLEMDKAIGQYNLDVQKYGVTAQAGAEKRKGKTAMYSGITQGLTTVMGAVASRTSFDTSLPKKGTTP